MKVRGLAVADGDVMWAKGDSVGDYGDSLRDKGG
jgi:hypothetical protein